LNAGSPSAFLRLGFISLFSEGSPPSMAITAVSSLIRVGYWQVSPSLQHFSGGSLHQQMDPSNCPWFSPVPIQYYGSRPPPLSNSSVRTNVILRPPPAKVASPLGQMSIFDASTLSLPNLLSLYGRDHIYWADNFSWSSECCDEESLLPPFPDRPFVAFSRAFFNGLNVDGLPFFLRFFPLAFPNVKGLSAPEFQALSPASLSALLPIFLPSFTPRIFFLLMIKIVNLLSVFSLSC